MTFTAKYVNLKNTKSHVNENVASIRHLTKLTQNFSLHLNTFHEEINDDNFSLTRQFGIQRATSTDIKQTERDKNTLFWSNGTQFSFLNWHSLTMARYHM